MAKVRKKKHRTITIHAEPTPEQFAGGQFERAGLAYRRVPVIDTLYRAKQITEAQYAALCYYRDQATAAEDDACVSGPLDPVKIMGGGCGSQPIGGYIPASLIATPAILETARIERDLGSLRDIANAIAVQDLSLSQWCVRKHGGRERYNGAGAFIAVVPINEKEHVKFARLELQWAASRIVR